MSVFPSPFVPDAPHSCFSDTNVLLLEDLWQDLVHNSVHLNCGKPQENLGPLAGMLCWVSVEALDRADCLIL